MKASILLAALKLKVEQAARNFEATKTTHRNPYLRATAAHYADAIDCYNEAADACNNRDPLLRIEHDSD